MEDVLPVDVDGLKPPPQPQDLTRPALGSSASTVAPPPRTMDKSVKFTIDTKVPLKERRNRHTEFGNDQDVKLEMDLSDFASS
jgi:hypothetical protein